jgi:hypothetical protein
VGTDQATDNLPDDGTEESPGPSTDSGGADEGDTAAPDVDGTGDTAPDINCPEGSTPHTTSSGAAFCCSETYPVFCDENDAGYPGGCWSEGASCETLLFCIDRWSICYEGTLPYCDETDGMLCFPCQDESRMYETASGRPGCCTEARPTFCDENEAGYTGGCWTEETDCETITACGGSFSACASGMLPYCQEDGELRCYPCPEDSVRYETTSGRPVCCTADTPTFCDENDAGYHGGCWSATIDCDTIIQCNGLWSACEVGRTSSCEENVIRCLEAS